MLSVLAILYVIIFPTLMLSYFVSPSSPRSVHRCHHRGWCCSGDMSVDKGHEKGKKSNSRPSKDSEADSGVGVSATEKRFAYSLLEKLLEYFDKASVSMTQTRPSSRYSRRGSFTTATEDVKFFGKVSYFYLLFFSLV